MQARFPVSLFLAVFLIAPALGAPSGEPAAWHHPLCLAGGGVWKRRVAVDVHNRGKSDALGRCVTVPVGKGRGEADLGGARAEAFRICDAEGTEMLFRITGRDGRDIRRGPVPAGSSLALPVQCKTGGRARYYIYFDNPSAWEVPDFLKIRDGAQNGGVETMAGPVEVLELREVPAKPGAVSSWDFLLPAKVFNTTPKPLSRALVSVDLSGVLVRDSLRKRRFDIAVGGGRGLLSRRGSRVFFEADIPARSAATFPLYLRATDREAPEGPASYKPLLESPLNLVRDGSFEDGGAGWSATAPHGEADRTEPGLFGKHCARLRVGRNPSRSWLGRHQSIAVQPGGVYLYSAWVKCRDVASGDIRLHAHLLEKDGRVSPVGGFTSVGPSLSGTHDWTLLSGRLTVPPGAVTLELHLTMNATGTVWYDGVVVARVTEAVPGRLRRGGKEESERLTAWPVNSIVKVFREDVPPREARPLRVSLARGEKEPLQIAIRGPRAVAGMKVEVDAPRNEGGVALDDITVNVVGYVPIDHKTNYYRSTSPEWHRKLPSGTGGCDGWPGFWPDPLLPRADFDLAPGSTQPVWITFGAAEGATAGDYHGAVRLVAGGKALARLPLTVRVWDFALPARSHVAAVYDLRLGRQWFRPGEDRQEARRRFLRFMAERRVCPNRISPDPVLRYENGRVIADFEKYDAAAAYYLDELQLPMTYTPGVFYLFGWGHPPGVKFGEKPYEGDYPYEGVDRSKLRPAFKKAYQACLRAYWEHMKARGWDKRCVLYISDEPHDSTRRIRDQMKALCAMIHEVDPAIPIYSSTWHYQPAWDGSLDIWGIGHYGIVSPDRMERLKAGGSRLWFTTDGQMCTDTPYCAVERLLPHYCFRYGVEAYEFWGISWLTYDPYRFGWHSFIHQSPEPGTSFWVRYPNGDGYLAYPGKPVGHAGPVTSIRLEQAREGVEDFEYLYLLRSLVEKARAAGRDPSEGQEALAEASRLVEIPNAGGRYSTRILPDPDAVLRVRERAARVIESLTSSLSFRHPGEFETDDESSAIAIRGGR